MSYSNGCLETFVSELERHVLRLRQLALDVGGSSGPGDEPHPALCQGQKRGRAEPELVPLPEYRHLADT